ncbi:hypothetical protein A1D31_24760 [Bradyrhizobium liaoningense]|nr:hypothetical protein A1D31_24760 [Bradyrhizobium liaoningense]
MVLPPAGERRSPRPHRVTHLTSPQISRPTSSPSQQGEFPALFRTVYEPEFFEAHLSLFDKITAWRTLPVASLQLVTILLLLPVMTASVG